MENEVVKEVTQTNEEVETETEEEVTEEVETETEVEEENDDNSKDTNVEDKPKKQSSAERKRYAEMRRAKEAKEREEAITKAKREGIIEGLGGTNPYTGEKITDDIDFELYQEMKDAESKGYDPMSVTDMLKYRKSIAQEAKAKNAEAKQEQEKVEKDVEEFVKQNPNVDVKELFKNEDFMDFADELMGKVPLTSIYKKYTQTQNLAEKKAEDIAISEKARREASVGSLTTGDNNEGELSIEDIANMSREEIDKNYDKVYKSYFKN